MKKILVDVAKVGAELDIGRFALGQGGLSREPMIDGHIGQLRNLRVKLIRLFLQEYFHVYPRRGVYDWSAMDRAVDAILATGAKPMMAICLKPRALFPKIDQTVVHPSSYKQWDELIYQMVRHYNVERKCGIEYWEVGNEPDIGETGGCPYLFTEKNYPEYYEHTARAIRRADPNAKVGGPALSNTRNPILPALLEHCASGKAPLDFVSWHIYNDDPAVFADSITFVKSMLARYPALSCETTINEWNVSLFSTLMKHVRIPEYQPCFIMEIVHCMLEHGLSHSCYYHIRNVNGTSDTYDFLSHKGRMNATDGQNYGFNLLGLFDYQGIMRPAYFSFKMLARLEGRRVAVSCPKGNVKALAAFDTDSATVTVLLWNFAVDRPRKETINLSIRNAGKGNWRYTRYVLDAATDSCEEDRRMRIVDRQTPRSAAGIADTFELAPYGVTLVNFKRN